MEIPPFYPYIFILSTCIVELQLHLTLLCLSSFIHHLGCLSCSRSVLDERCCQYPFIQLESAGIQNFPCFQMYYPPKTKKDHLLPIFFFKKGSWPDSVKLV